MQITKEIKDGMSIVSVKGSISSVNVSEFEAALADMPGDTDGVIIDASELEYISSAGLRVILRAKKQCKEKTFRVTGVNREVMNIFDMTGFSEIMDIEAGARKISIDGCEIIGSGACGECYRIDDETIIKLYYGDTDHALIEHEKALSKKAFVMGIPTAISYDIVEADGRCGVIYELIRSKTLGELMRQDEAKLDEYIDMYVNICKTVHATHTSDPEILPFKEENRANIKEVSGITDEERNYLYRFLDMVPESDTCIHGDLNINNIMVQNGECCLIDMGELSTGIPMFDISRILFSMIYANTKPGEYNGFYKMMPEKVEEIYHRFFKGYFGCDSEEEAKITYPEIEWLHPLAWFRCCTSFLKGTRWSNERREQALRLLRECLIPFVDARSQDV